MMRITALPITPYANLTSSSLKSSNRRETVNAVTCRRSGQDGTETRQNLVNGTQANQQVLSSFMREENDDDNNNNAPRSFQVPANNGCSKTPLVPPAGCTKSFFG